MRELIDKHKQEVLSFESLNPKEIELFRIKYLGKSGILNKLFNDFKKIEASQKKEIGLLINDLKNIIKSKINPKETSLKKSNKKNLNDYTLPSNVEKIGSLHPLSIVENKIIDIFKLLGFNLETGPEIEDDWHNFSALNMPENHPARDMQDTFFINKSPDLLLRTHTSSVQIRFMENTPPPIRIISPGRVFRNENISSRSHCLFHQIEGLAIDENINFSDLKLIIQEFINRLFGENKKIRFRPSFFPFTEPSAEVDIYWGLETETDKKITKGTGWLEIMGCGMVDPNVLKNVEIDSNKYSGFAFGMGIERIAMLLYQIDDIRLFYENDVRFLKQFKSSHII